MTTYAETQEGLPVQIDVDHGVLVATIRAKSLLYEMAINEVEECIVASLPDAKCALLVDCGDLTLHVSSQFLSMLVRVHRKANEAGLKMGICNLSEALQMVYNVTALRAVLPAYGTRQQAIADLGEFDVWERRPLSELDSEVQQSSSPTRHLTKPRNLAIAAFLLLGVAAIPLVSGLLSTLSKTPATPTAFRSSIHGSIFYLQDGVSQPDARAMVITWPAKLSTSKKLQLEEFQDAKQAGWIDLRDGISLGRVDTDGSFVLPTLSQADHADYHVLIVSENVQRHEPIARHDQMLLGERLADVPQILGDREFAMGRVQVGPSRKSRFDWTFTSQLP